MTLRMRTAYSAMMLPVAPPFALTSSGLGTLTAIMAVGLVVGVFGHIIRSRLLIVLGIAVVGAVSVYFGVFVAKVR
jgi:sulfite exporter TauE/SafE